MSSAGAGGSFSQRRGPRGRSVGADVDTATTTPATGNNTSNTESNKGKQRGFSESRNGARGPRLQDCWTPSEDKRKERNLQKSQNRVSKPHCADGHSTATAGVVNELKLVRRYLAHSLFFRTLETQEHTK
jgi:hypothetical protein